MTGSALALVIAIGLAGCGDSASSNASASTARTVAGQLTVTNADGSMVWCAVGANGSLGACKDQQIGGLSAPGSIDQNGGRVFISDVDTNSVAVCAAGVLAAGTTCTTSVGDGAFVHPLGVAVSGAYIYVTNSDNTLAVCAGGDTGTLSGCSQVDTGGTLSLPVGIVADSQRVYIANQQNDTVTTCQIGGGGQVSNCTVSDGGANGSGTLFDAPAGITVTAQNMYVTNIGDDSITSCAMTSSGAPTNCQKLQDSTNLSSPLDISVNGSYAYVSNLTNNSLAQCLIGANGALSSCTAGTAGNMLFYPTGVAFTPSAS